MTKSILKSIIREYYNNIKSTSTCEFDEFFYEFLGDTILNLIHLNSNSIVLDLGCGNGAFCRCVSRYNAKVIGVDLSKQRIKNAKSLSKRKKDSCGFLVCDAENLPFRRKCVHYTFSFGLLEYIKDPSIFLEQVAFVSKKKVFLTYENKHYLFSFYYKDIVEKKIFKQYFSMFEVVSKFKQPSLSAIIINYTIFSPTRLKLLLNIVRLITAYQLDMYALKHLVINIASKLDSVFRKAHLSLIFSPSLAVVLSRFKRN